MKKILASPVGRLMVLAVVLSLCLLGSQAATATSAPSAGTSDRPVAVTPAGELTSRVVGATGNGRQVSGAFVPLRFVKRNGKLFVRGLVEGVVHERDGSRTTFAQLRTMRVKSVNGTRPVASRAAAEGRACDILHLVLAPLDLDLLGLKVHLDRVVLDIVAATGGGRLLGNLLCAVTGLLDGGLQGLLGRLTDLLNQILGRLRLG
ncbi:hypothetical protein [Nocardioides sp. T2.26MG-1]|uniref:hypothetical protein n=1 Tax=Nocardioides sp. T2.26MG-1 TaxID=3041166 RepID=UPI00247780FF|nr:hypothetical protein [Nocardioides sp. T2.26MG-1]CAI9399068.1 hypothetical protein HIDPHFAB_00117 [Nocardioides sp. T2.26MG-1]